MSRCSSPKLETYLRDYGWSFRNESENSWVTGWQGQDRSYPLTIDLNDTWVILSVTPFLKLNIDWDSWPEISRYLLELNHQCHMVKIVINDCGDIALILEILASNLAYNDFSDALGILGYYADFLYDEILSQFDRIGFQYAHALNFLA